MQAVGSVIPLIVVAALVAGGIYAVTAYRRQQRERIVRVAAEAGLQVDVDAKKPPKMDFDLFETGSSKKVAAHMWRAGEQDSVFQYEYTTQSGENSTTHRFTAALIALPFRAPHMVISSENAWTRVKRFVGLRDIEIESPEFNDRYHVKCRDERFAITLLDPAMISWLLSPGSGRGAITFEFGESWLLCHGKQIEVELLPGYLAWAQSVRNELPTVLTDLYGGRA